MVRARAAETEARRRSTNRATVRPCDRATVDELVTHHWVTSCGALPEEVDEVGIQLLCDECDENGGTAATKLRALLPTPIADAILCGKGSSFASDAAAVWRRRLVLLVYAGMCALALLSFNAHGGLSGVETSHYLHDGADGD